MVFRNIKYEENIRFPFLYLTMGATEVDYVPNIDIQMGTRRFGREQNEKNAPNVLFSHKNKTTSHSCFSGKRIVSRNIKYEENIRFPFLYLTMAATEVGSEPNIDIQRGTRCFGREQHEKNAPNAWFSGTKNTRKKLFSFFFICHYGCDRGGISGEQ
jgi:hypothetical protein